MSYPTKDHHRVSQTGRAMGRNAARLAAIGLARLKAVGLDGCEAPALRDEMCKTCACREGSVPNGCLQTQLDFLKSVTEGKGFYCHSPRDGRVCAGWIAARAEVVARPLPEAALKLIEKWEYSPADSDEAAA